METARLPDRAMLRSALFPVALRAVERGEHPGAGHDTAEGRKHTARIVANYAASDLLLAGRTLQLRMDEVEAALGMARRSEPEQADRSTPSQKAA